MTQSRSHISRGQSYLAKHFEKLAIIVVNQSNIYDETILSNLPLRATAQGLDHTPTKLEMLEAIVKLHDSAPGASGLRASAWKMEGISGLRLIS